MTRRRGATASSTVPSTSREPAARPFRACCNMKCHDDPFFQSETMISPKKYCFVISPLVSASQSFCGLVRDQVFVAFRASHGPLTLLFEIRGCAREGGAVLAPPAVVDEPDRHRIEVVELPPTVLPRDDESRLLEHAQVLHHAEAGHRDALTELPQGLAITAKEAVEDPTATAIGESLEDRIVTSTGSTPSSSSGPARPPRARSSWWRWLASCQAMRCSWSSRSSRGCFATSSKVDIRCSFLVLSVNMALTGSVKHM